MRANVDRVVRRADGTIDSGSGWAFMVATNRPPDAMALASEDDDGRWVIHSVLRFSRLERPDLAAAFGSTVLFCGWNALVPAGLVLRHGALLLLDRSDGGWRALPLP
jgi:hypothetical protein